MALVLTKPTTASGNADRQLYSTVITIPSTHTAVVDQSMGTSVKWIITVSNTTDTVVQAYEVLAIKKGTTAVYNVYGFVGDNIDTTLSIDNVSGEIHASVMNNEMFDVVINITRIGSS